MSLDASELATVSYKKPKCRHDLNTDRDKVTKDCIKKN